MTELSQPLVSCICVTHNSIALLKRSVECFQQQTYTPKELIVAFTANNTAASDFLSQVKDPSIKTLEFSPGIPLTLGEKRNMAVEFANGFYFCVWDDDDWYSRNRLDFQLKSLEGTALRSSALSSIILYDVPSNQAYLSATRWAWEQTLLCQKSVFDNPELRYANLERGEDSGLLYNLKQHNLLLSIKRPDLYIYVYHGNNSFHRGHWEVNILPWGKKLPDDQSSLIQKILEGKVPSTEASSLLDNILT
jgi:glycosyltransferase involved in cell wall biosynthesis